MADERTQVEKEAGRRYLREFGLASVGYGLAIVAILVTVDFETAGSWKYAAALVPLIPAIWGVVAVTRHVARVDEMQRSIMESGFSLGFGLSMVAAMTLGLLAIAGLHMTYAGPWIIYAIGMGGWMVGSGRASNQIER